MRAGPPIDQHNIASDSGMSPDIKPPYDLMLAYLREGSPSTNTKCASPVGGTRAAQKGCNHVIQNSLTLVRPWATGRSNDNTSTVRSATQQTNDGLGRNAVIQVHAVSARIGDPEIIRS